MPTDYTQPLDFWPETSVSTESGKIPPVYFWRIRYTGYKNTFLKKEGEPILDESGQIIDYEPDEYVDTNIVYLPKFDLTASISGSLDVDYGAYWWERENEFIREVNPILIGQQSSGLFKKYLYPIGCLSDNFPYEDSLSKANSQYLLYDDLTGGFFDPKLIDPSDEVGSAYDPANIQKKTMYFDKASLSGECFVSNFYSFGWHTRRHDKALSCSPVLNNRGNPDGTAIEWYDYFGTTEVSPNRERVKYDYSIPDGADGRNPESFGKKYSFVFLVENSCSEIDLFFSLKNYFPMIQWEFDIMATINKEDFAIFELKTLDSSHFIDAQPTQYLSSLMTGISGYYGLDPISFRGDTLVENHPTFKTRYKVTLKNLPKREGPYFVQISLFNIRTKLEKYIPNYIWGMFYHPDGQPIEYDPILDKSAADIFYDYWSSYYPSDYSNLAPNGNMAEEVGDRYNAMYGFLGLKNLPDYSRMPWFKNLNNSNWTSAKGCFTAVPHDCPNTGKWLIPNEFEQPSKQSKLDGATDSWTFDADFQLKVGNYGKPSELNYFHITSSFSEDMSPPFPPENKTCYWSSLEDFSMAIYENMHGHEYKRQGNLFSSFGQGEDKYQLAPISITFDGIETRKIKRKNFSTFKLEKTQEDLITYIINDPQGYLYSSRRFTQLTPYYFGTYIDAFYKNSIYSRYYIFSRSGNSVQFSLIDPSNEFASPAYVDEDISNDLVVRLECEDYQEFEVFFEKENPYIETTIDLESGSLVYFKNFEYLDQSDTQKFFSINQYEYYVLAEKQNSGISYFYKILYPQDKKDITSFYIQDPNFYKIPHPITPDMYIVSDQYISGTMLYQDHNDGYKQKEAAVLFLEDSNFVFSKQAFTQTPLYFSKIQNSQGQDIISSVFTGQPQAYFITNTQSNYVFFGETGYAYNIISGEPDPAYLIKINSVNKQDYKIPNKTAVAYGVVGIPSLNYPVYNYNYPLLNYTLTTLSCEESENDSDIYVNKNTSELYLRDQDYDAGSVTVPKDTPCPLPSNYILWTNLSD